MVYPTEERFSEERGEDNQLLPRTVELETVKPENIKDDLFEDIDLEEDTLEVELVPPEPGEINEFQSMAQKMEFSTPENDDDETADELIEWVSERLTKPEKPHQNHPLLRTDELSTAVMAAIFSEATGRPQEQVRERFNQDQQESFRGNGDAE